jgi:hypothetical protein
VVSFVARPLYPVYPLVGRLVGPQSRSGRGGEEKNFQPPPRLEPPSPDRPALSLVAIPIELSQLCKVLSMFVICNAIQKIVTIRMKLNVIGGCIWSSCYDACLAYCSVDEVVTRMMACVLYFSRIMTAI